MLVVGGSGGMAIVMVVNGWRCGRMVAMRSGKCFENAVYGLNGGGAVFVIELLY